MSVMRPADRRQRREIVTASPRSRRRSGSSEHGMLDRRRCTSPRRRRFRLKSISWVTPRFTLMSFFASDVKPGSEAVIVYGPPTRMPGIRASVRLRHRLIRAAGRLVNSEDGGAGDDRSLRVLDDAADRAGGDTLRVRAARGPQQDAADKKSKRSEQTGADHVISMAAVICGRHIAEMDGFRTDPVFYRLAVTPAKQKKAGEVALPA